MSMIAELEAAQARCVELEKEITVLKAELATLKAPPTKPAAPVSLTPTWDAFNAIKDPARRQAFWVMNEEALRAEQKANGKR